MDSIDRMRRCRSGLRLGAAIGLLVGAALVGCGRPPFPVAPVHGTVTIDGQPLTTGKVMFAPIAQVGTAESGKPGFGPLGADGSFALSTYADNDGAVVGEHWATIIALPNAEAATTLPEFNRVTVPQKMKVIAGQDNEISIALTSRDIARLDRNDD